MFFWNIKETSSEAAKDKNKYLIDKWSGGERWPLVGPEFSRIWRKLMNDLVKFSSSF